MLIIFPLLQILAMSNCFRLNTFLNNNANGNSTVTLTSRPSYFLQAFQNNEAHAYANRDRDHNQHHSPYHGNSRNKDDGGNSEINLKNKNNNVVSPIIIQKDAATSIENSMNDNNSNGSFRASQQVKLQLENLIMLPPSSDANIGTVVTTSAVSSSSSSSGSAGEDKRYKNKNVDPIHRINKMDFDGAGELFDISTFHEDELSDDTGGGGYRKTVYEYVPSPRSSAQQFKSFFEEMQESKEKKTNVINDGDDDSWVPAVSAVVIVLIVFSISVFACCLHCPFCFVYRMNDPQRII